MTLHSGHPPARSTFARPTFARGSALVAALLLSGCGGAAQLAAPVVGMFSGAKAQPAPAALPKDGAEVWVTLRARGIKFPMKVIDRDGPVVTLAAQDGAQVILKDGVLFGTRGLGLDLMSSTGPSVAELAGGAASHSRTADYLDGTDSPDRRSYTCETEPGTGDKGPANARHIREVCHTAEGKVINEFWIDGGLHIVQSKQWVSKGVGYLEFVAP